METICPIMSNRILNLNSSPNRDKILYILCRKKDCEFWIQMYTTECKPIWGCAINFIAQKSSEGQIRV